MATPELATTYTFQAEDRRDDKKEEKGTSSAASINL